MNPRIIVHLVKTEWQRLWKPVLLLWILLILSATPLLFHDMSSFKVAFRSNSSWSSTLGEHHSYVRGNPQTQMLWSYTGGLATIVLFLISALLGMRSREWMRVSTVRPRERFAATVLFLACFIALPPALLAAAHLAILGFDARLIPLATGKQFLFALLLGGAVSAFSTWSRRLWEWIGTLTALAGAYFFLVMMFPRELQEIPEQFLGNVWNLSEAPRTTTFLLLAALTAIVLGRISRGWTSLPARVGMPVLSLLLASGLTPFVAKRARQAQAETGWVSPSAPDASALVPVIRQASMTTRKRNLSLMNLRESSSPELEVSGIVEPQGLPPGYQVEWKVGRKGWLWKDGRKVAQLVPDEFRNQGEFQPPRGSVRAEVALANALPTKPMRSNYGGAAGEGTVNLGRYRPVKGEETWHGDAELEVELDGTVYRYETLVDGPVSGEAITVRAGQTLYNIRQFIGAPRLTAVQVAEMRPLSGYARGQFSTPERAFLHLPMAKATLPLEAPAYDSSPLIAQVAWRRQIFTPEEGSGMANMGYSGAHLEGARLIIVKPVVLARLSPRTVRVQFDVDRDQPRQDDFTTTYRYRIEPEVYARKLRTERPDPQTCTKEQFGRWLRMTATSYHNNGIAERDLAEFAPRFSGILAKVAGEELVSAAIELGTPESQSSIILDRLSDIGQPAHLVEAIARRGWLPGAAAALRENFLRGELNRSNEILMLEDPATYPRLLANLMKSPTMERYERVRQLPGIQPELKKAIAATVATTDLTMLLNPPARTTEEAFGIFPLAAKEGDADALSKVLQIFHKLSQERNDSIYQTPDYLSAILPNPPEQASPVQDWIDFLAGKSAEDFRYDPLRRQWIPTSDS